MYFRRWPCSGKPDAQVFKDGSDHFAIFDEADDLHWPLAFRAYQRIYFIYFLDQSRPVFPEGFSITLEPDEAEVVIINTCSFIESATQESIETILEAARLKKEGACKILVVTGCFPQRYKKQLIRQFKFSIKDKEMILPPLLNKLALKTHSIYIKLMDSRLPK